MSTLRVASGPAAGTSVVVDGEIVIGRENVDLTILDTELSRRHAIVRPAAEGVVVEDLGSTNGTFVDGSRITGPVTLTGTATIRVGRSEISLELSAAAPTRAAPVVDAPRAPDEPIVPIDDATRARGVPVADVDEATRARDVPVADVDEATRARDVPADVDEATRARDVPVADVDESTRARDVPVAPVSQPTRARPTSPNPAPGESGRPPATIAGVPTVAFAAVAFVLLVVILILLLG